MPQLMKFVALLLSKPNFFFFLNQRGISFINQTINQFDPKGQLQITYNNKQIIRKTILFYN